MPPFDPISEYQDAFRADNECDPCTGPAKVRLLIAIIGGILLVAFLIAAVLTTPGPSR